MENASIPKVIHYIWIGGNPKPPIVVKCIESWKKFLPDFEIKEWNESNYDISSHPYVAQAYACKKWAFASDYMRFDILYQHGGIYLDTDVEFLKTLPDYMLNTTMFSCCETNGKISPGLIMGSGKGMPLIRDLLDDWPESFDSCNLITVNEIFTDKMRQYGYQVENKLQRLNNITIYPDSYFCSYDRDVMIPKITNDSISVHHYASTWVEKGIYYKLRLFLKHTLGIRGYRVLLRIKRYFFGVSGDIK